MNNSCTKQTYDAISSSSYQKIPVVVKREAVYSHRPWLKCKLQL